MSSGTRQGKASLACDLRPGQLGCQHGIGRGVHALGQADPRSSAYRSGPFVTSVVSGRWSVPCGRVPVQQMPRPARAGAPFRMADATTARSISTTASRRRSASASSSSKSAGSPVMRRTHHSDLPPDAGRPRMPARSGLGRARFRNGQHRVARDG